MRGFESPAPRRSLALTIKPRVGDAWPVEAIVQDRPRTIPAVISGQFEVDMDDLRALVDRRSYGEALGGALLRGAIRDAFVRAVGGAEPLHLLLSIDAPELRPLLWERLCGPPGAGFGFLALDQRVAYSRHIPSPVDHVFRELHGRDLRALVVIACPAELAQYGLEPFDVEAMAASVRAGLGDIPCDILGHVHGALGPATLDELCAALTRSAYPILHIVAHGRARSEPRETLLFLEGPGRAVDVVEKHDLVARLGLLALGLPHFIFFAACQSGVESGEDSLGGLARGLVGDLGVPAVLAMSSSLSIATAEALTRAFYARLRAHGHVDQALVEASAGLAGSRDALVPALYSRLGPLPLFVAEDGPAPADGPQPEWSSTGTREWSEALQRAHARRERLRAAGQATAAIDAEISGLRQRLRKDGQLHAGDLLGDGRYLLLALVGEGLSSTVWRSYDRKLGREVAVKVLHPQHARSPDMVRRFQRAANRMRELDHPHIVPVLEAPEEEDGRHFFVMQYMPGGTLADAVRRRRLAVDAVLPIVRALGSALEYAHGRRLLHRDVEPGNVLFDADDRVRLCDFDMALTTGKALDTGASHISPAIYVAPECLRARPEARPETDVYSLAMTTLYMYAGAAPLEATRHPRRFVGRLDCPPAVRKALLRAGAFDPRARYPTVAAFLAALDEPATPWPYRRGVAMTIALVVVGVALTIAAVLWL